MLSTSTMDVFEQPLRVITYCECNTNTGCKAHGALWSDL